jgi:hypothetical protein
MPIASILILANSAPRYPTGEIRPLYHCVNMRHIDPALLSMVATLVFGSIAAYIAYQQWRLTRYKFRLDLFEKRYKVYAAAAQFLSTIMVKAAVDDEDLSAFDIGTMDAVFLYPKQIMGHLQQIRCRAIDMRTYQKQFEQLPVGDERSRRVNQNHAELIWLSEQLESLPSKFDKYLSFKSVK